MLSAYMVDGKLDNELIAPVSTYSLAFITSFEISLNRVLCQLSIPSDRRRSS